MDAEIEDFNWNLRHLLDVLSTYQTEVNKANKTTFTLLEKTLDKIGDLIGNADEVNTATNNDIIVFSIDDKYFEIKRSIFCRVCEVDFGTSRKEYMLHSADAEHHRKLIDYENHSKVSHETVLRSDSNNNRNQNDSSVNDDILSSHGDELKKLEQHQNEYVTKKIPNVFEDDFFDFLESRGNEKKDTSENKVTNDKALSTPPVSSWRDRPNGNTMQTIQPNQNDNNSNAVKRSTQVPLSKQTPQVKPTKPAPITQSIIQNGAVLSGMGIKPCPTYELNNLYVKFPHLNPDKVSNPLKPTPLGDYFLGERLHYTKSNHQQPLNQSRDNRTHSSLNGNRAGGISKSSLTSSLMSLPTFTNKNVDKTPQNESLNRRMPGRSSSSISLVGVPKANVSNPQNSSHKQSKSPNAINRKAESVLATGPNTKNKGAIPKQPINTNQSNNKSRESESVTLINIIKLEKFFEGDITSIISYVTNSNSKAEKIVSQKKLIDSIENMFRDKFPTVKCYLIGSHAYNIAKGGLAAVDIYVDLCDSFHKDKSGPTFVSAMNEALQLMKQSNDWSNVKCTEQSRYGMLLANHKWPNLKPNECRFMFGTGVAVRNTEVINSLFAAQSVARQLVICIRLAVQEGAIGEWAKDFSGYIVTLLVIFYLQTQEKLPSVLSLQSDSSIPIVQCGENVVHFKAPTNVTICKNRLRDLMIGFFEYYKKFDFSKNIISPFEGCVINRNIRNAEYETLSRSLQRFKSLIESEPKRWTNDRMCIQDIFEHKRNVTQRIGYNEIKAFKEFCTKSLAVMQAVGDSVKY